jgi:LmbE family N-acetylglucosaminyl deacetylase
MDDEQADFLVISAHPDDAEVQMSGTAALLAARGWRGVFIDLCDGEPSDFDPPGLLELYEAEDAHMGRLVGVAYAETFRAASPLAVADPAVFLPGVHA